MIVQRRIHSGLMQRIGPALFEENPHDEDGNNLVGSFMDYLIPNPGLRGDPAWEIAHTITPVAARPARHQGRGESATVDALARLGVTHLDIPTMPD